jgi:multidrug efflux pump subunit AcrA (membrane-fusion protein)
MLRAAGIALAALAALAVAGWATSGRLATRGDTVAVETVDRGPFARVVHADGVLEAEEATQLTVPATAQGGLKIAWLAEDGTAVRRDDVVVRFDPTDMEEQLRDGRAEAETVEAERRGTRSREGAALDNLRRDAGIAERELDYVDAFPNKDPDVFSRVEIVESTIDRLLAVRRRDHALDVHGIREALLRTDLDLLDLERRGAELKIDQAREGLSELEIRAPHDGILVLRRDRGEPPRVGEMVWRGNAVAEIPRLERMRARVFVLEADAGGVSQGAPAEVVLEAHPDRPFAATVETVSALAKRRSRWSPVQYFEIELALDETDAGRMKPGQRVRARLHLDAIDDALTVSREAVFTDEDGVHHVWRRNGDGFERVPVELGPGALGRAVVRAGIEVGDVVALEDPERAGEDEPAAGPPAPAGPSVPGAAS